jgi:hypothetical protein
MKIHGQEERPVTTIPRIIHQIWINSESDPEIPKEWVELSKTWKNLNPGWDYRLWQTRETAEFVAQKYPSLVDFYEAFTTNVQKSDMARFLLLDAFGGFYADMDMECLQPLEGLIGNRTFLACCESLKHARLHGLKQMLCTNFMASAPGHPFLMHTMGKLLAGPPMTDNPQVEMDGTGPLMFTRAWKSYGGRDVTVLEAKVACPFDNNSGELEHLWQKGPRTAAIKRKCVRRGTYGLHYWSNSWGRGLSGPLKNPDPHLVKGYRFYPGWESYGYDLVNVGRNIEDVVRECDKREAAVGFNTAGFIKHRVRRRSNWHRIRASAGNEGLYIKESRLPLMKYFVKSYAARVWERLRGLMGRSAGG